MLQIDATRLGTVARGIVDLGAGVMRVCVFFYVVVLIRMYVSAYACASVFLCFMSASVCGCGRRSGMPM